MTDATQEPQSTAITVSNQGSLAAFSPDPERVKALAAQFVMTLTYRGSEDLTYKERIALAAAALAYNLSPALGQLWYIHDQGMFVGAPGWVAKMNEHADKHGYQWRGHEIRLFKESYADHGIPDNAQIAFKYIIRRSDFDDFYSARAIELVKAGFNYEQCKEIIGPAPQITGIGWVGANEKVETEAKGAKMSVGQKAIKRAMVDALKKIVHLPFAAEGDTLTDGRVVESTTYLPASPKTPQPDAIDGEVTSDDQEPDPIAPADQVAQISVTRPANVTEDGEIIDNPTQPESNQPVTVQAASIPLVPLVHPSVADSPTVTEIINKTAAVMGSPMRRDTQIIKFEDLIYKNPVTLSEACTLLNGAIKARGSKVVISQQAITNAVGEKLGIQPSEVKANAHWVAMIKTAESLANAA